MKRYAYVTGTTRRSEVEAYLPANYEVVLETTVPAYEGSNHKVDAYVIAGEDVAGWTLDGYVQPRYASGLMGCVEIDLSHPLMKQVLPKAKATGMKTIEYRVTGSEGEQMIVQVQARDINVGFGKATKVALERVNEIHSVEFWKVCDLTKHVSADAFAVTVVLR